VTFTKNDKGWMLDGSINPTVRGLVNVGEVPAGLRAVYEHCVAERERLLPDVATMIAICKDAGERFTVTVNSRRDAPSNMWYVIFSKPGVDPDRLEAVITVVDEEKCPGCGRPYRELRGPDKLSRAHNVLAESKWVSIIRKVLQQFGVSGNDKFIEAVLGVAGPKGPAVAEDRQCRECEEIQDQGRSKTGLGGVIGKPGSDPHSMPQRRAAARIGLASSVTHSQLPGTPGGDIYTGMQFARITPGQERWLVRSKVADVIDEIRGAITLRPGSIRPANHPIYTNIVRGARVDLLQGGGPDRSQHPGAPALIDPAGHWQGPPQLDDFLATLRVELINATYEPKAPETSPP
jgi:hypothetical protein